MRLDASPPDPATVLAKAAAFDNRKPDPATTAAWGEALASDMTTRDALNAVTAHYATETRWIMPADVNSRWQALKRARIDEDTRHPAPYPPSGLTPHEEARWLKNRLTAITRGATREQAIEQANQQLPASAVVVSGAGVAVEGSSVGCERVLGLIGSLVRVPS